MHVHVCMYVYVCVVHECAYICKPGVWVCGVVIVTTGRERPTTVELIIQLPSYCFTEGYADLTGIEDIHAITGALKLYLRELPLPLMTFEAYEICLIAASEYYMAGKGVVPSLPWLPYPTELSTPEERMDMLKVGIQRLPPSHYNTLKYLIRHLHK